MELTLYRQPPTRREDITTNDKVASYCQKLVPRVSGSTFGYLFSVLEFDSSNDLGDLVRAIQASPPLASRLTQLEDHGKGGLAAEAALGLGGPDARAPDRR